MKKSWFHVRCDEKFPGELYEADVLLLTELVAVQGDVASQARHPGDKPRSELPEQDRRGEVEFDLLQPLLTLPVQLGGVWEVVVVQALSLVYIWGRNNFKFLVLELQKSLKASHILNKNIFNKQEQTCWN